MEERIGEVEEVASARVELPVAQQVHDECRNGESRADDDGRRSSEGDGWGESDAQSSSFGGDLHGGNGTTGRPPDRVPGRPGARYRGRRAAYLGGAAATWED